jgi:hypothetical protein
MEKQDLIRYRTFADALIRLNNAASTLLQEGADPEAIKLILSGTAKLFAELERRLSQGLPEDLDHSLDLKFPDPGTSGWDLPSEDAGDPQPRVDPSKPRPLFGAGSQEPPKEPTLN